MKGIATVRVVFDGIRNIVFPTLSPLPAKPDEDPREKLIQWGTTMYTYSVIAHLRRILSALVLVASAENIPAANILSRHIFELAAHACYMSQKLKSCLAVKNWQQAVDVLRRAALGNYWAKQHGGKYGSPLEVPAPVRIGDAISEYERYQSQEYGLEGAKESYSYLSELSHPNAACFQQYHIYAPNGRDVNIADAIPPISPLPYVNWSLIDILRFTKALLELSKETRVGPYVDAVLGELVKRAPATRA